MVLERVEHQGPGLQDVVVELPALDLEPPLPQLEDENVEEVEVRRRLEGVLDLGVSPDPGSPSLTQSRGPLRGAGGSVSGNRPTRRSHRASPPSLGMGQTHWVRQVETGSAEVYAEQEGFEDVVDTGVHEQSGPLHALTVYVLPGAGSPCAGAVPPR